jgi:hypothetical protein
LLFFKNGLFLQGYVNVLKIGTKLSGGKSEGADLAVGLGHTFIGENDSYLKI